MIRENLLLAKSGSKSKPRALCPWTGGLVEIPVFPNGSRRHDGLERQHEMETNHEL